MADRAGERDYQPAVRTFLIVDIRGYTRFTRERGDEAASRLAAEFAAISGEGVEAWGGTLLELRGDEALAVFHSPRRALRCAVELQSAFAAETQADPDLPLRVGIGLDAGEAVPVGDGYRGAALNLAARLCAVAGPGQVIASEGLIHLAGTVPGLMFSQLAPTELKGFDGRVNALLVKAEETTGPTPTSPDGGVPPPLPAQLDPIVPLVGRERDMRWLSWHWRRVRHGSGRTVVISGPPGIGKTRVSAELAARAHAAGATVEYLPAGRGLNELHSAWETRSDGQLLAIVDDLDAAPSNLGAEIDALSELLATRPALLLVTHRQEAAPALIERVSSFSTQERRRELASLEPESVRSIAALYAGPAADALPIDEIMRQSGGVPAAVHRVVSAWAREAVTGQLGAFAHQTSAGRRGLRAAEHGLASSVEALELARERTALYGAGAVAADATTAEQRVEVCPYKGLAAFEPADSEYFFGRERLVAELAAKLVGSSFVGVVGASGSGKSSAIRAGLLPALAGGVLPGSDSWLQVVLRPGEHPLAELGRALAAVRRADGLTADDPAAALAVALDGLATDQRLVLVVDQFEEVFNATRDEAERQAFIELLTAERRGLKVVVAMRVDHYGHCAPYPDLARSIGTSQVLVGPLSRVELASVIERPAQRVGLRVEPGLTETLLDDLGDEPGSLPLLSTALLELWQARDHGRLTLAAYHATGGVRGAVARLAEAAYARLEPGRQLICRAVFLRLAGAGEGEGVVRRRVPLSEFDIHQDSAMARVLEVLTDARLLTTGEGHIEVAHEALLREWPRLQGWLAEDAAGRQLRLHLTDAARDWEARGREAGDLYRGARLAAALEWSVDHDHELNASEREYLETSRAESERELARQRRTNRRLRVLLAGAGVFLILAVAAGGFAALQLQRAEDANLVARSHELAAYAISFLEDDPPLAKLLALSAARMITNPPIETISALHQAWAADRIVGRYDWPEDRPSLRFTADLHPSGQYVVASQELAYVEVRDLEMGTVLWSDEFGPGMAVNIPFFGHAGDAVIAGITVDDDPAQMVDADRAGAYIWDARSGDLLHYFELGPCGGVVTGASETHLLVSTLTDEHATCYLQLPPGATTSLHLLEIASGERMLLSTETGDSAMSGDGGRIAYDDLTGEAPLTIVIDVASGERLMELDGRELELLNRYMRDLNADGSLLLYGDRPMLVLEVGSGDQAGAYSGHAGEAWGARFARDGESVFSAGRDGSLHNWSARGGEPNAIYRGLGAGRPSLAEQGTVLVPDPDRDVAWLLDTSVRSEGGAVFTCASTLVYGGTLKAKEGISVHTQECDGDYATFVVDLEARRVARTIAGREAGQGLGLSHDGSRILSQPLSDPMVGPPEIVDLTSGEALTLQGVCSWNDEVSAPPEEQPGCNAWPEPPFPMWNWQLQWSPDDRFVAAIDLNAWAYAVWDASTGELRHVGPPLTEAQDVIFTPESSHLIVAHGLDPARGFTVLSTATWEAVREVEFTGASVSRLNFIGYASDGSTLLAMGGYAGSGGGSLYWLDADTLQPSGRSIERIHEGSPKSYALSPDRSLMATGASDGYVRVWDVENRSLVHEFRIGEEQVQGVAFVNDQHLAIAPQSGHVFIYTIDRPELIDIVRRSLPRGFTEFECERFAFGDDCPTLEEMRAD